MYILIAEKLAVEIFKVRSRDVWGREVRFVTVRSGLCVRPLRKLNARSFLESPGEV